MPNRLEYGGVACIPTHLRRIRQRCTVLVAYLNRKRQTHPRDLFRLVSGPAFSDVITRLLVPERRTLSTLVDHSYQSHPFTFLLIQLCSDTMPTPNHTPMSSRHTIPPRLTVPPFPPQLYRRLLLTIERDGLLLRPQHLAAGQEEDEARTDNAGGVMIKWGVKGAVQPWSEGGGQGVGRDEEEDEGVVVGGILGIVRLWDGRSLPLLGQVTVGSA